MAWWNPVKLGGLLAALLPIAKKLWYSVKKDVPREQCINCRNPAGQATGMVPVEQPDGKGGFITVMITCPICDGSGKVRAES